MDSVITINSDQRIENLNNLNRIQGADKPELSLLGRFTHLWRTCLYGA